MKEVSAPVIGIALILSAVFIPVAFIPGLTGRMYQQFALTIAISVLLSAFSALSLSPALAAMLLKKPKPARGPLGVFFRGFNKVFDASTNAYLKGAGMLVRKSFITIILVGVVCVGAGFFGSKLAAGFIPEEDQGILGVNVTLPAGASLERTSAVLAQAEADPREDRGRRVVPDGRRLRGRDGDVPAELRHDLHAPEALGGAPHAGPARVRDHEEASARVRARSLKPSSSRSTSPRSRGSAPRPGSTS